ncbi:MAG: mechanosensitive ion channel family protein [Thermomicrobiales bacterium]
MEPAIDVLEEVGETVVAHTTSLVRIATIIVVAILVKIILRVIGKRVLRGLVTGVEFLQEGGYEQAKREADDLSEASPLLAARGVQRAKTIGSVLNNLSTWVIVGIVLFLILEELDFDATTLMASAGILAAALAFGAQDIVKDMLNGFFMVFEDQIGVGDFVEIGTTTGVVEAVGIRVTQVRSVDGTLWFIRNGEIVKLGNKSQTWARVVFDLPAPYDADVEAFEAVVLATARSVVELPEWKPYIIEQPEIWGMQSLTGESMVIRLVLKTTPAKNYDIETEIRRALKTNLDAANMHLPIVNRMVVANAEDLSHIHARRRPPNDPPPVPATLAPAPEDV